MKIKTLSLAISMAILSTTAYSDSQDTWVVMDESIFPSIELKMRTAANIAQDQQLQLKSVETFRGINIAKVDTDRVAHLTSVMHQTLKRCGGYTAHNSLEEAKAAISAALDSNATKFNAVDYSIDNQDTVNTMISSVEASQIVSTISHLSSYTNRYYKTSHGETSAKWIKDHWQSLTSERSDANAELYLHDGWGQPSVILTIEGTTKPDEVVVMGGHLDSTVSGWVVGENTSAPGADDDASGIAVLTESIRIMMESGYRPERTLKIMGYAAEEAGLLGSAEIAKDFAVNNVNVVGVIQFDMTNYKGSAQDIFIYTDFTNNPQNQFIKDLISEYQNVTVGESQCGYGCSDHASWHGQGFPASFPFEANFNDLNPNIHTADDTLPNSDSSGVNSVPFAVLALSYAGELAKGSLGDTPPPPPPPTDEIVTETFSDRVSRSEEDFLGSFKAKVGTKVTVQMTGSGDADLYVRMGSEPNTSEYDCRPYNGNSTETCEIVVPARGEYPHVMVRGYSWWGSNYTVNVTYTKE